jgi:anaphase-promoting complex subunit 1
VVGAEPLAQFSATSASAIRITRDNIKDLVYTTPGGNLVVLAQGLHQIYLRFDGSHISIAPSLPSDAMVVETDTADDLTSHPLTIASSCDGMSYLVLRSGSRDLSTWLDYIPKDILTVQSLQVLALALPSDENFALHLAFLREWERWGLSADDDKTFEAFSSALLDVFELPTLPDSLTGADPWTRLAASSSHSRLAEDPAFRGFQLPPPLVQHVPPRPSKQPNAYLAPALNALHMLGEDLRLMVNRLPDLLRIVKLICRIAVVIRPEWVDYWKRLCPDAIAGWVPCSSGPCRLFKVFCHFGL